MDFVLNVFGSILAAIILDVIIVNIYNYATGADKDMFWRTKNKTLFDLDPKRDLAYLKSKIKILVIDDEEVFPIDFFKDNGYLIDRWEIVKDYSRLEAGDFDIIIGMLRCN